MIIETQVRLSWLLSFRNWLTCRRICSQVIVLAACLWSVCAIDFATPGMHDRAGNIKFQDFIPIYTSAKLVAMHRSVDLLNATLQRQEVEPITGASELQLPYLYGPQVALFFVPLTKLPFQWAAAIWAAFTLAIYAACLFSMACVPVLTTVLDTRFHRSGRFPAALPCLRTRPDFRVDPCVLYRGFPRVQRKT